MKRHVKKQLFKMRFAISDRLHLSIVFLAIIFLANLIMVKSVAAKEEAIQVVASIKPVQLLINEITGVAASEPTLKAALLLNENQSHQIKSLEKSQQLLVSKARYVFYISDEFETYMQAIRRSDQSPMSVFKYIELGKLSGVRLLSVRNNGDMPQIYEGSVQTTSDSRNKFGPDWHVWLNPDNAIVMLRKIRDVLFELDPNQRERYQRNYTNAVNKITMQSERVAEKMMQVIKKPFLTLHDGYQYFEEQYGLKSVGSILSHNDESPSDKRIAEARELIENYNIHCLFKESRFSSKTFAPVIENFDIQVVNLDTIGRAGDVQLQTYTDLIDQFAGVFYSSLMN